MAKVLGVTKLPGTQSLEVMTTTPFLKSARGNSSTEKKYGQ